MPFKVEGRRAGDTSTVYAKTDFAEKELGWKAKYGLDEMCKFMLSLPENLLFCYVGYGKRNQYEIALKISIYGIFYMLKTKKSINY